tara:strand:- start:3719 stop:4198 length:480 start_codon:yes stop_codon:yes gene_type:complete
MAQIKEKDMILKVMESEGVPLQAKTIAKKIYDKFNGYKLSRYNVRNHLWDKKSLASLIIYNKNDYTYSLKGNTKLLKDLIFSKKNAFKFEYKQCDPEKGVNELYDYKVKGNTIHIKSYLNDSNMKKVVEGLVMSELQSIENDDLREALNRIKSNLIDIL